MRTRASILTRLLLVVAAATASACCPAARQVQPVEPEPFPDAPVTTEPDGGAERRAATCDPFVGEECCTSKSAECEACFARNADKRLGWAEACGIVEPVPAVVDCGTPPPVTACCMALLPRCTACADRNRAVHAAWTNACGDAAPADEPR